MSRCHVHFDHDETFHFPFIHTPKYILLTITHISLRLHFFQGPFHSFSFFKYDVAINFNFYVHSISPGPNSNLCIHTPWCDCNNYLAFIGNTPMAKYYSTLQ